MAIRTVAFIGGGNASHVGAAVVAKLGKRARILTRRPEAFSSTMRLLYPDGHESESELDLVSSDPAAVVGDADIVLIGSPVNAYHDILENIADHVKPSAMVGTMFTQGFADLMIKSRIKTPDVTAFAMQYIPWQAKTIEYGSFGHLVGAKSSLPVAVTPRGIESSRVMEALEEIFLIPCVAIPFVAATITTSNQILHPARYYAAFQSWDGKTAFDPGACVRRERERKRKRLAAIFGRGQ